MNPNSEAPQKRVDHRTRRKRCILRRFERARRGERAPCDRWTKSPESPGPEPIQRPQGNSSRLTKDCRMPDRNFRDVMAEDVVALGCRSEGPPARRTGRARSDLRGVRLSLSPGIQTDSHRNPLDCSSKRASGRKPTSETFKFVIN